MIDKDGGQEKAMGMTRGGVPGTAIFEFYILNDQLYCVVIRNRERRPEL